MKFSLGLHQFLALQADKGELLAKAGNGVDVFLLRLGKFLGGLLGCLLRLGELLRACRGSGLGVDGTGLPARFTLGRR